MAFSFFMKRKTSTEQENNPKKKKTQTEAKTEIKSQPQSEIVKPREVIEDKKHFYAFVDASNLFWGGKESIGFGIDYRKLRSFLESKYDVSKIFYYAGLRIFDFPYSIFENKPIDLEKLTDHLKGVQKEASEKEAEVIERTLQKINFYQRLEEFGYIMKIKPAKVHFGEDDEGHENPILKANCDVDMTFDMMRYMQQYNGIVAMTGDGDFASVLNYLKSHDRKLIVISRSDRTAKEIRELAADDFIDFSKLEYLIKLKYRR